MVERHSNPTRLFLEAAMKPTWASALPLVLVLAGCQTKPAPGLAETDRAAIRATFDAAMKVAKVPANPQAKDCNAYCTAYYAENATLLAANEPAVKGLPAITKFMNTFPPITLFSPRIELIDGEGGVAYVKGTYEMTIQATPQLAVNDKGKYLEVWKKQTDGSWKAIYDCFSSDLPMTPPPQPEPAKK
jgi:ketosteroid isomerase-like protein